MAAERTSRRGFVKQAVVAATAAAANLGAAAKAGGEADTAGDPDRRLYRETREWRKYYATLR
jgi:anaerobic selenocysteine-containing dehydrogenase